mmetsp:Transcript_22864/g.52357  ORF Transcript_22864/g.52357 Transcript_22864/m.52357 type:complete len:335 (-) Transcript_22864:48-1052(-)
MENASRLQVIHEDEHCAPAALSTVTTTAGGTSTGSPGGGSCGSQTLTQSKGNVRSAEGHEKVASQWIQEMQPKLPGTAPGEATGAGLRKGLLRQLHPVAESAQLRIPPPPPLQLLLLDESNTDESSATTPDVPDKVVNEMTDPDVLAHGPLQQRRSGLAGLFGCWRPRYMVLKESVCCVYATETEWRAETSPIEVFEVADVIACDEPDFDGASSCTFVLVDRNYAQVSAFRCAHARPGPFDRYYSSAAKKLWMFAWKQARAALEQHSALARGFQAHMRPAEVQDAKVQSSQRMAVEESGSSTASTALEDTDSDVRPTEREPPGSQHHLGRPLGK